MELVRESKNGVERRTLTQVMSLDVARVMCFFLDSDSVANLACTCKGLATVTKDKKIRANALALDFQMKMKKMSKQRANRSVPFQYGNLAEFNRLFKAFYVDSGEGSNNNFTVPWQSVCSKAIFDIVRIARRDRWHDLASLCLNLAINVACHDEVLVTATPDCEDANWSDDVLRQLIYARDILDDDSSEDEGEQSEFETEDEDSQDYWGVNFVNGEGELILSEMDCGQILLAAIKVRNLTGIQIILDADSDSDSGRVIADFLKAGVLECSKDGWSAGFAILLGSLERKDKFLTESTLDSSFLVAAESGHSKFVGNIARIILARYARETQLFNEKLMAGTLRNEEQERNLMIRRRDTIQGTFKQGLIQSAMSSFLETIKSLVESAETREFISSETLKLVMKSAAMNGNAEIVRYLYKSGKVSTESVFELFNESCTRGFVEACRAFLSLQLFDQELLESLKKDAFLREKDEIVSCLEEAIPNAATPPTTPKDE